MDEDEIIRGFCDYLVSPNERIYYLGRLRGDLCKTTELVNEQIKTSVKYFELDCYSQLETSFIVFITILYVLLLGMNSTYRTGLSLPCSSH